jgi:hypothetical protein
VLSRWCVLGVQGPSGVGPPVHVDGPGPRKSEVKSACRHKGGMFGGGAHVALDVFILGHPVVYWGQGVWHIVRGGDPSGGHHACVLPPRQAAKLSRCGCDPSWFCSPHDACFIHESCLCEGSSRWPPVKPVRSSWVSMSREWLADLLSHRSSPLPSS